MVLSSFSFVSAAPDFADVKGTAYEEPVSRLELLNVLKGYPDGSFKPEGSITRAEFAAVAVRARGLAGVAEAAKGLPSGFVDVPATHWAAGYVGTAGSMGIVNGIGNGMFAPNGLVKYEEAVTMLVRALGYESDAQAKGGYPYGYLIVAEEIGLLDGARGTQGVFATRGLVAMLTDNALEIPMMIAIGTGVDARYIVSGEERTEEVYLLDYMGFDTFEGRVTAYNSSRDTITLKGEDNVTLDVADDFDYYEVNGVTIKAWAKDDMLVIYTLKDTVKFDAADWDTDEEEVLLVTEDEYYAVAKDAEFVLDNDEVDADEFYADFAKVVLNDDDEIVWAEGYSLAGYILVEELDDEVVIDLNDVELDTEDYTIVKDGKTISVEDLAKGDILFFNTAEEFAVVYNMSTEGVINRVYDATSFRVDTTRFSFSILDPQYLDGDDLGDLDEDVVRGMMDEESSVEIFKDFRGKVVLAVGDTGIAATSKQYAYVTADPVMFQKRSATYINLDVITENGEEIKFDVKLATANVSGSAINWAGATTNTDDLDVFAKGDVVQIVIDEDGELDDYVALTSYDYTKLTTESGIKVSAKYADKYSLQASAPMFWTENFDTDVDDIEVMKWSDAADEFTYVEQGRFYYNSSDKVIVVVAIETDSDEDTTTHFGLVTGLRKISNKDQYEITIEVEGSKKEIDTNTDKTFTWQAPVGTTTPAAINGVSVGDFAKVTVGDKSGLATVVTEYPADSVLYVIKVIDRTRVELGAKDATSGTVYTMVTGSVVYDDEDSKTSLGTLAKNDKVEVYLDRAGSRFVKYLRVNEFATAPTATTIKMYYTSVSPAGITVIGLDSPIAAGKYAVRIKTESTGLPVGNYAVGTDGVAAITAPVLTTNIVYTAELYEIDTPSVVLATKNFVAGTVQVVPAQ